MELKDGILVSGNADSTVKVWDIKTGQCLQTLQGTIKCWKLVKCIILNAMYDIRQCIDNDNMTSDNV